MIENMSKKQMDATQPKKDEYFIITSDIDRNSDAQHVYSNQNMKIEENQNLVGIIPLKDGIHHTCVNSNGSGTVVKKLVFQDKKNSRNDKELVNEQSSI